MQACGLQQIQVCLVNLLVGQVVHEHLEHELLVRDFLVSVDADFFVFVGRYELALTQFQQPPLLPVQRHLHKVAQLSNLQQDIGHIHFFVQLFKANLVAHYVARSQ